MIVERVDAAAGARTTDTGRRARWARSWRSGGGERGELRGRGARLESAGLDEHVGDDADERHDEEQHLLGLHLLGRLVVGVLRHERARETEAGAARCQVRARARAWWQRHAARAPGPR